MLTFAYHGMLHVGWAACALESRTHEQGARLALEEMAPCCSASRWRASSSAAARLSRNSSCIRRSTRRMGTCKASPLELRQRRRLRGQGRPRDAVSPSARSAAGDSPGRAVVHGVNTLPSGLHAAEAGRDDHRERSVLFSYSCLTVWSCHDHLSVNQPIHTPPLPCRDQQPWHMAVLPLLPQLSGRRRAAVRKNGESRMVSMNEVLTATLKAVKLTDVSMPRRCAHLDRS